MCAIEQLYDYMYSTVCMLGTLIYWPWYLEHQYRQGCNCHCQSGWDTTVNITCIYAYKLGAHNTDFITDYKVHSFLEYKGHYKLTLWVQNMKLLFSARNSGPVLPQELKIECTHLHVLLQFQNIQNQKIYKFLLI